MSDDFCVFNNSSSLGELVSNGSGVFYTIPFSLTDISNQGFIANYSSPLFNNSIALENHGNENFRRQSIIYGIGRKFNQLILGSSIKLDQYNINEYGRDYLLQWNLGAASFIIPKTKFCINIGNITQSGFDDLDALPLWLKVSSRFEVSEKVKLYGDFNKAIPDHESLSFGISYFALKQFEILFGLSTNAFFLSGGIAYQWKNWKGANSIRYHPILGLSHSISLYYEISLHKD